MTADRPRTHADDAALTAIRERVAKFRAFADSVHGFTFNVSGALAELDANGEWKFWDMKSPYSLEAREFISAAQPAIRTLLDTVAALERQLADAQARERAAVATNMRYAKRIDYLRERGDIALDGLRDIGELADIDADERSVIVRQTRQKLMALYDANEAAVAPADSADDGSGGNG